MRTSKLGFYEPKVLHSDELLRLFQRIGEVFEFDLEKARLEYSVEMDEGIVSSQNCSVGEFPAVFKSSSDMTNLIFFGSGVYVSFTPNNKYLGTYTSINSDNVNLFNCLGVAVKEELNLVEIEELA